MNIILNGRNIEIEDAPEISYEQLCVLTGYNPSHTPSTVYCLPDRRNGTITRGKSAPLVEGGMYEIVITGCA